MKIDIREFLGKERLFFDGGTGTLLQARGLRPGELPELWNLTHPEIISGLHREYLTAGANIIKTNTFGANALKFDNLEEIISAGIRIAKEAVAEFETDAAPRFVAFDMGPLGKMLKPLGDLDFEDAVALFAKNVRAAEKAGADLILIETMNDAYETKAAVLAAKENSSLPVFVTNAYDSQGKLMTGADPAAMVALLEGLRVDALGINCSLGPRQMMPVAEELLRLASVPVIVNPNAGIPRTENGKTVFDVSADEFADIMAEIAKMGASVLGGCCGTTPEYIAKTADKCKSIPYTAPEKKNDTLVSSYTHAVKIGDSPILIGERINPTGKSKLKTALRENNLDYIISEGIAQEERGAHILDVNVGLPEIDETVMMTKVVGALQEVTDLPLQIDTVNADALGAAMRRYNGKPLVNSVNGKNESMDAVLPLVAKYGGAVIALTLDEGGIPDTAEGRLEIAKRIVKKAAEYGIDKKDIIVDPLALTISSEPQSAKVTLEAIRLTKEKLGVCTSLGVSNISFGLPNRDIINAAFFTMALGAGLDCAIMNPFSLEMMKSYHAYRALSGMDENCASYVSFASGITTETTTNTAKTSSTDSAALPPLCYAIVKGMKDKARTLTAEAIGGGALPLDVINTLIVPALDIVGKGFEEKTVYLPQLLMSAEAAKSAFEEVRGAMKASSTDGAQKIVVATVKGDIHDIGKNIVKVLLENYGFSVIDLGKDVSPEDVCHAAKESGAALVGLSALMTTTVPAMEETIKMLRQLCPEAKVMVGGAVLTQKYADMIGADKYCRDAMQAVRYAEEVFSN